MKTILSLCYCFFVALTVCGQHIQDTTKVRNLLEEGTTLMTSRQHLEALAKFDTARGILDNTVGENNKMYFNILHRTALVYQNMGEIKTAITLYKQAILNATKTYGDKSTQRAYSYNNLGNCYADIGNYDSSFICLSKSLEMRIELLGEDHYLTAESYHNLGSLYWHKGEYDESIVFYKKALNIRLTELDPDDPRVADTYNGLANCYADLGDYDNALKYYKPAFDILLKIAGELSPGIANFYENIGIIYAEKGDPDRALENLNHALNIRLQIFGPDDLEVSNSYICIGTCMTDMGEYQKSRENLLKALRIRQVALGGDALDLGVVYFNLANCYYLEGNYGEAVRHYEETSRIWLKYYEPDHPDIALLYQSLGSALLKIGKVQESVKYTEDALNSFLRSFEPDNRHIADCYVNLSSCKQYVSDYIGAIALEEQALKIRLAALGEHHPGVSECYSNIAFCYYQMHNYSMAIEKFAKSVELDDRNKKPRNNNPSPRLINDLSNLGEVYRMRFLTEHNLSDLYKSRDYYFAAKTNIAAKRFYGRTPEDFAYHNYWTSYTGNIHTSFLLFLKTDSVYHARNAFLSSEESRSFSLYESLRESDALHFAGIPDTLLQQEYDLRIDIAYQEKKRFEEEIEKQKPLTDSILLVINSTLFDLKRSYEALKDTFEQQYPDYYRLKYDQRVESIPDVQASLLQPGQALLEYFAGDSSIFIFLVKKDDYRVFEVKKDFPLENWVKQLRFGIYGYHTAPDWLKSAALRDSALHEYISAATALYQKLLAPVDSLLPGRVVIVPDGILGYIPFEALLTAQPARKDRFQLYPYFGRAKGREHSISYSYSATLLREMTARKHRQAPTGSLLAYAPYYDGDTTLLASRFIDPANPANRLPALVYAAEEVRQLHDLLGGKAVIGRSARKDSLLREAGRYSILHLSTHGKANDKVGDYSFLAFSEVKDSLENEWLYVRDIYNLSLNADLVVLSACETGIGELKRGEGIISLARAFAYAGAKSIVTTLWSVDDAKTRDLMVFFYQNLKNGMTKDEALARARNDYFSQYKGTEAHPYFWAGFIAIGDMGAIRLVND